MAKRHGVVAMVACSTVWASAAWADEGMYLPEQLPALADTLREAGLELSADQLSDLSAAPLGAIISLGGCSASFVSAEGLVVTNHHCAVDALQQNSTAEENLLEDGFIAGDRAAERWAGPGSRVYITDAMTDVTETVVSAIASAASDRERFAAFDQASKALIAECEAPGGVRCELESYFGGQEYRLIRQVKIEDVRLVYAPPSGIGYYGGETDNWMWPRHTGDFTFFRAYVGPDGRPAPHSPDNVPFVPAQVLTVSTEGVADGSYVMVAGYPGGTYRYRTAAEMEHAEQVSYPWQIEVLGEVMALLEVRMAEDEDAAVRLGTLYFGMSNYRKNNEGMRDGFVRSGIVESARARDATVRDAVAALTDEAQRARLEAGLTELDAVLQAGMATEARDRIVGWMLWSTRLFAVASNLQFLATQRVIADDMAREAGYQERDWQTIADRLGRTERSYDPVADERAMAYFLELADELPADARIPAVDALLEAHRSAESPFASAAAALYGTTALKDEAVRTEMLTWTPEQFAASTDPIVQFAVAMAPLRAEMREASKLLSGALLRLRPLQMEAIRLASEGPLYPDANGSLRVTFGQVAGYTGVDGTAHTPFTVVEEIAAKHTGEEPFNAPEALLQAIASGEQQGYQAAALGSVPVAFISDVDTTGGNSGSATLDAQGRLVGLLFDGNYESMASDWVFDTEMSRSIHVDIRFVLWLMDRVMPAHHLLEEMGIRPQYAVDAAAE
jgi:hypothetical protein